MEYGIIHCSDTPPSMDIGVDEIRDWHIAGNGWADIGYALVVRRDGTVEEGRDQNENGDVFDEQGAHAKGFNQNGFGICLVGGHKGSFDFTNAQLENLWVMMDMIEERFPDIEWLGHCDVDPHKTCPNFNVKTWRYGDT